jgi:LPS O-antigen subunit length determinant protein (WzzB/FepE family)
MAPQSNLPSQSVVPQPVANADEINLLEYVYALVKNKWWIIGATVVGLVLGIVVAIIKGPTYVADATIAPKETDSDKSSSLSSLGALGSLVSSQLSLGGNASLDKIQLVMNSREFNAAFVEQSGLATDVIRFGAPKMYSKVFDKKKNTWKPGFIMPRREDLGMMFKSSFVKTGTNPAASNTLVITISSKDSTMTDSASVKYLSFLDDYLRKQVQSDASSNVDYLNKQLETTVDPLLREKLQTMIASEVEKEMLVSKEAFKVIDPPYRKAMFKEQRMYPLVFGAGLFFLITIVIIIRQAFSTATTTEDDRKLIGKIKKEIVFSRLKNELGRE